MAQVLWQPDQAKIEASNMHRFMQFVNAQYQLQLSEFNELYEWSVNRIADFWDAFWRFSDPIHSQSYSQVIDDLGKMPGAKWFSGARLNFAENLLRYRDDQTAILFKGEDQPISRWTYAQLADAVARTAVALKAEGVGVGDRVVGFMPNMPHTIIAMLAANSLGAVWSSCSPDFGIKGVLDRFGQIEPKVLFISDGYWFKGRALATIPRVAKILAQLPSVQRTVVVPYTGEAVDLDLLPHAVTFDAFLPSGECPPLVFEQLPFDHPLYIMYSSGTTGLPKCMVQSAGGILLHHLKELRLHTDLRREDVIFYFTTCGWMMWNWLTSSLAVGATLVLFDGNPFHPHPGALWDLAQEVDMTVFGTSAGYLAALQNAGYAPNANHRLPHLRAVLSTGSPLSKEGFEFVYDQIKSDVQLASISGGTDLNGCFALGNPFSSVYAGELQGRGLAMDVHAFDESGRPVINRKGELVCTAPFPSMPIYFWDDADGRKYHAAYFDVYPNVWRHGDYIEINDRGGVTIYGRSDATLNPGGVRIGTAEIYRQLEQMEAIEDSIVVGQAWRNDVRVVLFVKLSQGISLDEDLQQQVRTSIRTGVSPRHVPAKIVAVPDIPYTLNMKKVELAVKKTIEGDPVTNKDALRNPEALEHYANLAVLQED